MTKTESPVGRINQAELARRLGVSRPSVSKAVKAGRIIPDEDGLFDPAEAEIQWLENTRPKAGGITTNAKGASNYAQARARKESALARMAELRLEQATGALCWREDVDFVLDDFAGELHSQLDNIPGRLAPRLVGQRDVGSIERLLEDTFHQLKADLAEHAQRSAERLAPEGT